MEKKLIVKADMSWQCGGELFDEMLEVVNKMIKASHLKNEEVLISGFNIDYKELNSANKQVDFGSAIKALKQGKCVAREGWNGKGMFIFMRPADKLHIDMVIDKVKSLPQSVKNYFKQDVLNDKGERIYPADENDKVKFTAYLCLKAADGTIVNGWQASQIDMLAEDWAIL